MLDYDFDQAGLVRYDTYAETPIELVCLKRYGEGCAEDDIAETRLVQVLWNRDKVRAGNSTNIADGLEEAIETHENNDDHYGRAGAAQIIILMTDGQPNQYGGVSPSNCYSEDLWPKGGRGQDCAMYFAREALNQGIIVHSITLGEGADRELMAGIAEMTGGVHLHAESPDRLDAIFDDLFERIFLRLID
jgi:hypothetical protein